MSAAAPDSSRIAEHVLHEIRERADLLDVVRSHGVKLKRVGDEWYGCCPFHDESTPSFSVNAAKGVFHCFGCGASGNLFHFLQRTQNRSFIEVVKSLAERYAIPLHNGVPGERVDRKEIERAQEEEAEKQYEEAAKRLRERWEAAGPADPEHPYLKRKGITDPKKLRQDGDHLLVPMFDMHSRGKKPRLMSIQTIAPDGTKRFAKGGRYLQTRVTLRADDWSPEGSVFVAEGYATGSALHHVTGNSVVVAFGASNLRPVAKGLREAYPEAKIIIAADNDKWSRLNGRGGQVQINPGVIAARDAAEAAGALVAVPDFQSLDGRPTDFNDLLLREGPEAVLHWSQPDQASEARVEADEDPTDAPDQGSDAEASESEPLEAPREEDEPEALPPPPSLADTWAASLGDFLDPDPFILRPSQAGMGHDLDRLLGGGFTVGQTAALVSLGAGVGKTTLLHQFADGVAEASAGEFTRGLERGDTPRVVPVVFVSEMTIRDLSLRSMARQAGLEGFLLRDPNGRRGSLRLPDGTTEGEQALRAARKAAESFEDAARFLTPFDRRTRIDTAGLEAAVHAIRQGWEDQGAEVPAVLVIVDPIHRLLDPTRSEVESLGETLPALLDLAQRTDAIVLFSSDTTKAAAHERKEAGGEKTGGDLAHRAELAFRGSYQLLHLPDVALGLITLGTEAEHLKGEERNHLEREPDGTLYAEIVNAKSRWDKAGSRAGFFLDPAKFRFRRTDSRRLPKEQSLPDRILEFIRENPGSSENQVRSGVKGGNERIRTAVQTLLGKELIVDEGDNQTGRRLVLAENPYRTRTEQPPDNLPDKCRGEGLSGGAPPTGVCPPPGQPRPSPFEVGQAGEAEDQGDESEPDADSSEDWVSDALEGADVT